MAFTVGYEKYKKKYNIFFWNHKNPSLDICIV